MFVQLRELLLVEQRFSTHITHAQQLFDASFPIAPEVSSHGFGIHHQGIGYLRHGPSLTKQNHRMDSVRTANIHCFAGGGAQPIELLGCKAIVDHGHMLRQMRDVRTISMTEKPQPWMKPV
jgi:hypothetical protein